MAVWAGACDRKIIFFFVAGQVIAESREDMGHLCAADFKEH